MKCPICLEHLNSTFENSNIVFNGCCSKCLVSSDFGFNIETEITEAEAKENNLRIVNRIEEL